MLVVLGGFLVIGCSDDENDGAPFNTASYLGVSSNGNANNDNNGRKVFTVNGVSFTMIPVEKGSFQMGSNTGSADEKPVHTVKLSGYYIGETEVTQALWKAVMGENPSNFTGDLQRPVECVSYYDCSTFLDKLNKLTGTYFRLPTEAEWEYAARGGSLSKDYTYSGGNYCGGVAWYGYNSSSQTHPVKQKKANELGIYDMSGNVYEWCSDWYGEYSSKAQTNPTGIFWGSERVARGGSWYSSYSSYCTVTRRHSADPSKQYTNYGLRLAKTKY